MTNYEQSMANSLGDIANDLEEVIAELGDYAKSASSERLDKLVVSLWRVHENLLHEADKAVWRR